MNSERIRENIANQIKGMTNSFIDSVIGLGEMRSYEFEALINNYLNDLRLKLQSFVSTFSEDAYRRLWRVNAEFIKDWLNHSVEAKIAQRERYINFFEPQRRDENDRFARKLRLLFGSINREVNGMMRETLDESDTDSE